MSGNVIVVPGRFCGPPKSGNGGYCAGRLAACWPEEAVRVTLRRPPPLETPLELVHDGEGGQVLHDGQLVMEAEVAPLSLDPPPPPTLEEAEAMSARYVGFEDHLLETCFTCGPARAEGDGLRIFAGREGASGMVAAPWTPDASLAASRVVESPVVWAALDCPGYFAVAASRQMALLGRMHAALHGTVEAGRPHVVIGWSLGVDGRKLHAGTALFRADDGVCLGRARQTWIVLSST